MSREIMYAALQWEGVRRRHGVLLRTTEQTIHTGLESDWYRLLQHASALVNSAPEIRVRPMTLWVELEDLLAEWRELWTSEWFAGNLSRLVTAEWTLQDVVAHVASWSTEMRAQAETLAKGLDVGYRILFEEVGGPKSWNAEQVRLRRAHSLDKLAGEIERETARLQALLFELEPTVLFVERVIGIATAAAPKEPWTRSIAGIVDLRCFHDRLHINHIREWRDARSIGKSGTNLP
jgi:hypothetical protein